MIQIANNDNCLAINSVVIWNCTIYLILQSLAKGSQLDPIPTFLLKMHCYLPFPVVTTECLCLICHMLSQLGNWRTEHSWTKTSTICSNLSSYCRYRCFEVSDILLICKFYWWTVNNQMPYIWYSNALNCVRYMILFISLRL